MKKYVFVSISLLIIILGLSQVHLYHSKVLYIKDFKTVVEDYSKMAEILFEYYKEQNCSERIILDIDKSEFEVIDGDKKIDMNEQEKKCLKRVCENSYKGYYNYIWVTDDYIIFWEDETKMYGVIHTRDFKETRAEIREWYDGVQFRKIQNGWYELGHFGL